MEEPLDKSPNGEYHRTPKSGIESMVPRLRESDFLTSSALSLPSLP